MKFLVVDDHRLFAEGLQFVIEEIFEDAVCELTCSAEDGLALLDAGQGFDLILIDLNMPQIDGVSFIRAARARKSEAPMAVLSSTEDLRQIRAALEAGAAGFIPKSLGKTDLGEAMKCVLRGEVYVGDQLQRQLARLKPADSPTDDLEELGITRRQFEVLTLLGRGHSNKQIAAVLFVSEDTVKFHISALFKALNASNRMECILKARENKLLSD